MKKALIILATLMLVGCNEVSPNIGTMSEGSRKRIDQENQQSLDTPQKIGKTVDGGEMWCVRLEPYRGSISYHTYVTYPKPKAVPTPIPTYYRQTNVIVDGKPAFTQETLQGPPQ